MRIRLKPLDEQVVVVTGASSGIGLATARLAAKRGARLALASRNEAALERLAGEISGEGGEAVVVAADVGREDDVRRIGEVARARFGGVDTWVNNAGGGIYGRALEIDPADMRRLFDTNFWGTVYGSRIACELLTERGGGALVNVGSEVSDRAIPLQGIYSASKHAVKGWTDALRMELEDERRPISVTLIKPAAIDTPFPDHAKSYLDDRPKHAPPVYTPHSVAEAILFAATTPVRDLFVGSSGKVISTLGHVVPRLTDKVLEKTVIPLSHSGESRRGDDALHRPGEGLHERGTYPGMVRESLYTRLTMHPLLASAAVVGAGAFFRSLLRRNAN